eukprot:CAMPEP_0179246324 /NCGR_PEP_ID=MMETSP0797-20121207/19037_1 /TAXON_ID=47934 /ORGANISM="Dinophysis acuminata, Strain DAEP01" /LENGTH=331 /DNA_ID=CAMNT_0020953913 /DNA_START=43 /DNA_END=1036 /DNA_ORIENTATION=-
MTRTSGCPSPNSLPCEFSTHAHPLAQPAAPAAVPTEAKAPVDARTHMRARTRRRRPKPPIGLGALQRVVRPLAELAPHGHDVYGPARHLLVDAAGGNEQPFQLILVFASSAGDEPLHLLLRLEELLPLPLGEHLDADASVPVRGVERGDREHPQGLLDVADVDVLPQLHLREALRDPDDGLELTHGDGDRGLLLLHGRTDGDIVVLQDLARLRREPGGAVAPAVGDILPELPDVQRALALILDLALVQARHVLREVVVAVGVTDILDEEQHVETREDGGLEVHLVGRVREVVVGAEPRVGRGEHAAPRVQHRGDPRLRDGDRLLLHGLVDG